MTERKPSGMSFPTWIDQQIAEAEKRGVFDNLPGEGKPIPRGGGTDDSQAWLRGYLRREGVSADEMLPTPLRLRKEIERLAEAVPHLRSEDQVRDIVGNLNKRILQWRRNSMGGPPIFVPLVSMDDMMARWREAQAARASAPGPSAGAAAAAARTPAAPPGTGHGQAAARSPWWRRLRRPRRR
jgi:DnaJ homologue, subfamily C, member 28, conserved domain